MTLDGRGVARWVARLAGAIALAVLAGCATPGPGASSSAPPNPKDPLEPFNRKMFAFNDNLDTYALKPAATAYNTVVPSPVRTAVHNFFGNFSDAWSTVNQFLQGKPGDGMRMTMRVLTNTFIGIGGLLDPATGLGLERKPEDLGLTLGHWGVPPGDYLVLPLFGPSDVRDAVALPADDYVTPALLVPTTWQKVGVDAVGVVDARANLLSASQILNDIALDRYTFLRDAYVTRRRSLVYDGNPPDEKSPGDDDDPGPTMPAPEPAASPASGGAVSAPVPAASAPASAPPG